MLDSLLSDGTMRYTYSISVRYVLSITFFLKTMEFSANFFGTGVENWQIVDYTGLGGRNLKKSSRRLKFLLALTDTNNITIHYKEMIDKILTNMYSSGEIHPLTFKYVMLMDDSFKRRFITVKNNPSEEKEDGDVS